MSKWRKFAKMSNKQEIVLACSMCGQIPDIRETENLETHEKGWRVMCACPRRCASESRNKCVSIWNQSQ